MVEWKRRKGAPQRVMQNGTENTAPQEGAERDAAQAAVREGVPERGGFWHKLCKFLLYMALPVVASGIVRAIGIYIFVSPNHFAPGGINGIAVLLEYAVKWNSGYFLIMLNVPLFFLAFFCLGKKDAILSTASMALTSGLLIVFDYIPGFREMLTFDGFATAEPVAYGIYGAVAGGIFLGIALAIMLRCCGTAGGTAVLASVVHKKWRYLSVSWMTSAFDAVVVFASFFVYYDRAAGFAVNLVPVLAALVSLFVTSKTSDLILHGFKTAYKFEIVTTHPEEVSKEIMARTGHGVTLVHATGMYTHGDKSMLVCIIRKRQIAELQRIIRKYPDTFAFFSPTSEVYGKFAK